MHRHKFADELYRNRTNTVRNSNGTLAHRRDDGFSIGLSQVLPSKSNRVESW